MFEEYDEDEREWHICEECGGDGWEDIEQGEPPWTGTIRVACGACDGEGGWYEED